MTGLFHDRCIKSQLVYSNGMLGVLAGEEEDALVYCHTRCWSGVMPEPCENGVSFEEKVIVSHSSPQP